MKRIFTIAIVACLALGASAQTGPLGIKAGLNIANVSRSTISYECPNADRKAIPAYYVGISYEFPVGEGLIFQPEIVYSRQGAKASYGEYYSNKNFIKKYTAEATTKIEYLNVPMVLKCDLGSGFSVDFGLQVGLRLSIKSNTNQDKIMTNATETEILSWYYSYHESVNYSQAMDWAVLIGASYKINSNLDISARWNHGLTNIDGDSDGIKNRVFQLGIGYSL